MVLAMVGISAVVLRTDSISLYLVPFVAIPIFVRTFYDSRLALFIHIITILLVGFQAPNSFEFVFINFMAGVVAIFSLTNSYRRGKIFVATGWVFLVYALIYLALSVLKQGAIAKQRCRLLQQHWLDRIRRLALPAQPEPANQARL